MSSDIKTSTISIATWNVNSIRARLASVSQWLSSTSPDIILLQETKCMDEQFPISEINHMGYNVDMVGQKSYNGVAILSKRQISTELKQLPLYDSNIEDLEARYIEAVISFGSSVVRVASVYVPNGSSTLKHGEKLEESKRFRYKISFLQRLAKRVQEVLQFDNEYIVFGGDYNVALQEIDLYNPKSSADDVGFHKEEIKNLKKILNLGLQDTYRFLYPDKIAYSWWDYRRGRWPDDKGWRIDYLLSSKHTLEDTADCLIHKDVRGHEKASDHVPVEIKIKIS
ncbi:MAG: exodeoxyribonuclease III [Alphaproteobacteria bacterium]|nr:exodeoxyribonuclease III [Rickettsiales bacterium]